MNLYPAIDLKDNQCVRLKQGKFDQVTVYDEYPENVAKRFINQGARYLHIIDLDGAEKNIPKNLTAVKNIIALGKPVQIGGGIRSLETASVLLNEGVSRVILGTIAIEDKALLKQLIETYQDRIIVSIDALKGQVKTRGWAKSENINALDLAIELEAMGLKTIVYTDIEKDGMMQGPNFKDYEMLKRNTALEIIAAGGITTLDDLLRLDAIGLDGAIIGKALYENTIDLKEALSCLQNV